MGSAVNQRASNIQVHEVASKTYRLQVFFAAILISLGEAEVRNRRYNELTSGENQVKEFQRNGENNAKKIVPGAHRKT